MMTTTANLNWKGDEVKVKANKFIGKTMFELGLIVEGQAKLLAPKDTGRLAASITVQSQTNSTKPESASKYGTGSSESITEISKPETANQVFIGTNINYAPYMEFGTIRTNAQAFLRPALDLAKGKKLTIMKKNGLFYFKEYMK